MADASIAPVSTRHCKILVVPGALSIDVVGPLDVLTMAARVWAHRSRWDSACAEHEAEGAAEAYRVELISQHGGLVASSSSMPLCTARASHQVQERFDTLLLAGGTAAGLDDRSQLQVQIPATRIGP